MFNQHADNQIVSAEDEARMLGQPRVAPEHLLLAFAPRGQSGIRVSGVAGDPLDLST